MSTTTPGPETKTFLLMLLFMLVASSVATAEAVMPWVPSLPATHREIWRVDVAADAGLLEVLGDDYEIRHTDHFSIAHTARSLTVGYRGEVLESVYAAFVAFFVENGFELTRPETLRQVVLLPTREEFVRQVALPDLDDAVSGLHLTETNRAYFFDALGRADVREVNRANRDYATQLEALRRKILRSPDRTSWILRLPMKPVRRYSRREALDVVNQMLRDHRREASRLRRSLGQESIELMCHEIVHQLAQAMGVIGIDARAPRWVSEGLAIFFEPSENGFLLETGSVHWARLDALQKSHQRGERIALRDLLTQDALLLDPSRARLGYAESWSLVHFLATRHPERFMEYLRRLQRGDATASRSAGRIALFESALGADVASLESSWQEHVAGLSAPPVSGD